MTTKAKESFSYAEKEPKQSPKHPKEGRKEEIDGVIPDGVQPKENKEREAQNQPSHRLFAKEKAKGNAKKRVEPKNAAVEGIEKDGIADGKEEKKQKVAKQNGKKQQPLPFPFEKAHSGLISQQG